MGAGNGGWLALIFLAAIGCALAAIAWGGFRSTDPKKQGTAAFASFGALALAIAVGMMLGTKFPIG